MKQIKKAAVLLCAVLLCLMAVPVSAAAEVTVSASSVTAKAGETVTVPITVTRIENVIAVGMHIWYDPAVLKCVDAQMSQTLQEMDMANANTEPKTHPNEVWLTAISATPKLLEGDVMTITFEVLENAPAGATPIKVLSDGLSISVREDLRRLTVDAVDGSVTVVSEGSQDTSEKSTTVQVTQDGGQTTKAPASDTEQEGATTAPNDGADDEQSFTRPNGETVKLPKETAVDIEGNVVTDVSGKPSMVTAVAILLDEHNATPGETVTVTVSMSAVAQLKVLGVSIRYDTKALTFEGGECTGFVKDGMNLATVVENTNGVVDISATDPQGVSGSGDIAQLRFKVKGTARNGEYRLSVADDPLVQTGDIELPVEFFAGEVRVEGGAAGNATDLYVALGIVAIALIAALIVWLCLRRKKASPVIAEVKNEESPVVDVSGENEE